MSVIDLFDPLMTGGQLLKGCHLMIMIMIQLCIGVFIFIYFLCCLLV